MSGFKVQPPVIAKAGSEFTLKAGELTCAVNAFRGASQIPSSAVGMVGQDALNAYNDLLAKVTDHLGNLQKALEETGTNLGKTAQAYETMERANTLPSR